MAAQHRDFNIVVVKFFLPGAQLRRVGEQVIKRAMLVVWIAAGTNLGCLHSQLLVFLNQLIKREIGERRIKNSDQNFAAIMRLGILRIT